MWNENAKISRFHFLPLSSPHNTIFFFKKREKCESVLETLYSPIGEKIKDGANFTSLSQFHEDLSKMIKAYNENKEVM